MFGIGGWELALILIFGFIIVGPERLPKIGRTIGRALRQFQRAQDQANDFLKKEVYDPFKDVEALKDPFNGFNLDMSIKGIQVNDGNPTPTPSSSSAPVNAAPTRFRDGQAGYTKPAPVVADASGQQVAEETFSQRKERLAREKYAAQAQERNASDGNAAGTSSTPDAIKQQNMAASLYGIPESVLKRKQAAEAAKAQTEAKAQEAGIDLDDYAAKKAREAEEARKAAEKAQRAALRKKRAAEKPSAAKKSSANAEEEPAKKPAAKKPTPKKGKEGEKEA